ncbi:MAG: hypothetical protein Kow0081_0200 [Candidatus Dojkabacteria bacterium]
MHLHVIDVTWDKKSTIDRWVPLIVLYNRVQKTIQKVNLEDYTFNWKLSETRTCVGFYEKNNYVPCPFSSTLQYKFSSQCSYCEDKTGFRDAFIFKREPNENIKEYIYSNHRVYLAYFYPDIIKVGTAVENRNEKRLIEQDAQAYVFIAEKPNGIEIQELESKISKRFKLKLAVASRIKKKQLYNSDTSAIDKLKKIVNKIYSDKDIEWELFEKDDLVFKNLSKNYMYFQTRIEFLKLSSHDFILSGIFQGLRGNYLFVKNNGVVLGFDTRDLVGRSIVGYKENYQYENLDKRMTLF